jgi:hypothetical protein
MSDMELVKEALYDYADKAGESLALETLLRIEAELERLNEELRGEVEQLWGEVERSQEENDLPGPGLLGP